MPQDDPDRSPGPERRSGSRRQVSAPILYRTARMKNFASGRLVNISDSGVLISVDQVLDLNTRIYFIVETASTRQDNLHVVAIIVRKRVKKGGAADYGCEIIKTGKRPLPPIWDSELPAGWEELIADPK
jgi:hypothetical protein